MQEEIARMKVNKKQRERERERNKQVTGGEECVVLVMVGG